MTRIQKQIRFENFFDLQSRLVLLPYQDSECLGAVVASYTPKVIDVTGYVLTGIQGVPSSEEHDGDEDWMLHVEYTEILSLLREAPTPLLLTLSQSPEQESSSHDRMTLDSTDSRPLSCDGENEEENVGEEAVGDRRYPKSSEKDEKNALDLKASVSANSHYSNSATASSNSNSSRSASTKIVSTPVKSSNASSPVKPKKGETETNLKNRFQRWGNQMRSTTEKLASAAMNVAAEVVQEKNHETNKGTKKPSIATAIVGQNRTVNPAPTPDAPTGKNAIIVTPASGKNEPEELTSQFYTRDQGALIKTIVKSSDSDGEPSVHHDHLRSNVSNTTHEHLLNPPEDDEIHPADLNASVSDTTPSQTTYNASNIGENYFASRNIASNPINIGNTLDITSTNQSESVFGLFLQSVTDGYIPLDDDDTVDVHKIMPTKARSPIITNVSLLAVRYLSDQSRPMRDHKYQWFRSTHRKDTSWLPLHGATRAVYQPSATDLGYRVKCVITVNNDYDTNDYDEHSSPTSSFECTLRYPIEADPTIFAAAQESFREGDGVSGGTGATFNNLIGCGNADGRIFRIVIEQGFHLNTINNIHIDANKIASNLYIFQVSGDMVEPLHNHHEPIFNAAAEADALRSDVFFLALPPYVSDTVSMIHALCSENRLEICATDRVARETFLVALGIANYCGNLSNLNVKTILFPDEEKIDTMVTDSMEPTTYVSKPTPSIETSQEPEHTCVTSVSNATERNHEAMPSHAKIELFNIDSASNSSVFLTLSKEEKEKYTVTSVDQNNETSHTVCGSDDSDIQVSQGGEKMSGSNKLISDLQVSLDSSKRSISDFQEKVDTSSRLISDLQRRLYESDKALQRKDEELKASKKESAEWKRKMQETQQALQAAEKRIDTNDLDAMQMRKDFQLRISTLEKDLKLKHDVAVENEKLIKSLQNEKAVLAAGIEARESKLTKMSDLQNQVETLPKISEERDALRNELAIMINKEGQTKNDLFKIQGSLTETQVLCEKLQQQVNELTEKSKVDIDKLLEAEKELESLQGKYQALKTERNSLKQKSDSLVKEMSRMRRSGVEVVDLERIVQENAELLEEVSALRLQKKKLSDELDDIRNSAMRKDDSGLVSAGGTGTQSNHAEALRRALEQKTELEKLVKELTEYVSAKEAQLATMKDVNRALTEELQFVARSRNRPLKSTQEKDAKTNYEETNLPKTVSSHQLHGESFERVMEERDSLRKELVNISNQATETKNELSQTQAKLAHTEEKLRETERRLVQTLSTCDRLEQEVNTLNQQSQDKIAKMLLCQKEKDSLLGKYEILIQTQGTLSESQVICHKLQQQAYDLTQQLQDEKNKLTACEKERHSLHIKNQSLEKDRIALNAKVEGLSSDMSRICRGGMGVVDIERMLSGYSDLVSEVSALKAQKKALSDEMSTLTQKLAITTVTSSNSGSSKNNTDALKHALMQKVELERVVKELTEYVNAKEMQLETMKKVNQSLTEEVQYHRSRVGMSKNDV